MIVDQSADIALTAKRVLWAKMANAGQVCHVLGSLCTLN